MTATEEWQRGTRADRRQVEGCTAGSRTVLMTVLDEPFSTTGRSRSSISEWSIVLGSVSAHCWLSYGYK